MREKIKRIVKSRMCAQAETVNSFILICSQYFPFPFFNSVSTEVFFF